MQTPPNPPDKSPDPQWTILKILQWTTSYFKSYPIDSPRLTAEILLAHLLGIDRLDLYLRFDQPLSRQELSVFKEFIKRRVMREPVAYITGHREFWGLDFIVTPDVLIPRPETEFLIEASFKLLPADVSAGRLRVLDIGTGSGAVIVSLAVNRPGHEYFASDISTSAIRVASENAVKNNLSGNIRFFVSQLFQGLPGEQAKFDLILSNPPYIPSETIGGLEPEVAAHEPKLALDGGSDGLDVIGAIIRQAPDYMNKNATLMLEIGFDQKARVQQMVSADGRYTDLSFIRDYSGHNRVAKMIRV